jgi:hypothetical protein
MGLQPQLLMLSLSCGEVVAWSKGEGLARVPGDGQMGCLLEDAKAGFDAH